MQSAIKTLIATICAAILIAIGLVGLGLSQSHKAERKELLSSCCTDTDLDEALASNTVQSGEIFFVNRSNIQGFQAQPFKQLLEKANLTASHIQTLKVDSKTYLVRVIPHSKPTTLAVIEDSFFYPGMPRSWMLVSLWITGVLILVGVVIYRVLTEAQEYLSQLKDSALFTWNNFQGVALRLSESGRILDANNGALDRMPDCIGQILTDIAPDKNRSILICQLELVRNTSKPQTFECTLQEPSGEESVWLVQLQPCQSQPPHKRQILFSAEDVTQSASLQARLEREQLRLLTYLDSMQTLLIVCDDKARILHANQPALSLLEQTSHSLLESALITHISPSQKGSFKHYWEQLQTRPSGHLAAEFTLVTASGQERTISWRLSRIDTEEPHRFLFAGLDVTETSANRQALKAANDRIREALAEAEYANQSKSTFLANMSHEIRTPMNGVMGAAQLVLGTELDEQQRGYLDMIYQSSQVLLEILNDILDLSKIESGRLELEHIPFDLAELLSDLKRLFDEPAKRKGLSLIYYYEAGLPTHWKGDPKRIRQVMTNLISNALKFTEHGRIEIRVTAQPITSFSRHNNSEQSYQVSMSVKDTGVGIAGDKQDQIFTAFRQADSSTSRRFGGTGLGLTICRHLAEAMGGGIQVESKAGEGSQFEFTALLEPTAADQQKSNNPVESSIHFHGEVLLAEDNEVNQTIASRMLAKLGFNCTITPDGHQALQDLAKQSFDLILMDINMPLLDGLETTRRIRTRSEHQQIPIVALTANAMLEDRQRCLQVGMNGFLAKPIKLDALRTTILEVAPHLQARVEIEGTTI